LAIDGGGFTSRFQAEDLARQLNRAKYGDDEPEKGMTSPSYMY